MCGIAGKIFLTSDGQASRQEIDGMLAVMRHRGPDGQGIHLDGPAGLGHLRLSIIDLDTGAQPMTNEDGTVWIVFNGEIYNYRELRALLVSKGHVFRSHSDTEVIIHLYEEFGQDCVHQLRGMFAFAIWDSRHRRLFLARDRVGIKPLYYYHTAQAFWFASELKAILTDPAVPRDIHLPAVRTFLSFNYVPGEETLCRGILKLLPGHSLVLEDGRVTQRQYWDLRFTRQRGAMSFDEAAQELLSLLGQVVKDHMMADVPVGVLLSGGVDSSAILSLAVQSTEKKIATFTVGFDGDQVVDERPYARLSAARYGTDHHEISLTAGDFWDFLPAYVRHMEEPVCEPPAVALYYVSKLARHHVKVLLSGEGGDEAFAGYPNYPNMLQLDRIQAILGPLARTTGAMASLAGRLCGGGRLQRYGEAMGRPLSSHYFSRASGPTNFFNQSARQCFTPGFLQDTAPVSPARIMAALLKPVQDEPLLNQMLYLDSKTWLPDDLLVKADKMTMANSVELRVPLLDHEILEFAASLPPTFKVEGKNTKRVLKAAFAKLLPEEVLNRKKAGFPVPYGMWLGGALADGVRDLLLSPRALGRGYLEKRAVERLLQNSVAHGQGAKEVFSLIALELWHREFLDAVAG